MFDELKTRGVRTSGLSVGGGIAGRDHENDVLDACIHDLFGKDLESGFWCAVAVDEALEGKGTLRCSSGSDESLFDFHGVGGVNGWALCSHRPRRCQTGTGLVRRTVGWSAAVLDPGRRCGTGTSARGEAGLQQITPGGRFPIQHLACEEKAG